MDLLVFNINLGGYLSGKKEIIDHLRLNCQANVYAEPIAAPLLVQIITSLKILSGQLEPGLGRLKIQTLSQNADYFHRELVKRGFLVCGRDSPVVPLLLFHPAKIPAFSRMMLERGIAVVVVGYPATPIISSRVRFCISAAHKREDLEWALEVIDEVGGLLGLNLGQLGIESDE